jgi:hypothetical protein
MQHIGCAVAGRRTGYRGYEARAGRWYCIDLADRLRIEGFANGARNGVEGVLSGWWQVGGRQKRSGA